MILLFSKAEGDRKKYVWEAISLKATTISTLKPLCFPEPVQAWLWRPGLAGDGGHVLSVFDLLGTIAGTTPEADSMLQIRTWLERSLCR